MLIRNVNVEVSQAQINILQSESAASSNLLEINLLFAKLCNFGRCYSIKIKQLISHIPWSAFYFCVLNVEMLPQKISIEL